MNTFVVYLQVINSTDPGGFAEILINDQTSGVKVMKLKFNHGSNEEAKVFVMSIQGCSSEYSFS